MRTRTYNRHLADSRLCKYLYIETLVSCYVNLYHVSARIYYIQKIYVSSGRVFITVCADSLKRRITGKLGLALNAPKSGFEDALLFSTTLSDEKSVCGYQLMLMFQCFIITFAKR